MALNTKLKSFVMMMICLMILKSKDTLQCDAPTHVNRCPRNQQEWKIREKELNCQSLHQSNDSKTELLYHCVLNAEGTELIEVCAPSKKIYGSKCTEFNDGGSIIHESYISCEKFQVPCPTPYNSTKAYEYQECYDIVEKEREKRKNRTENYDYKCSCFEKWTVAAVGGVIANVLIAIIYYQKKQNNKIKNEIKIL
uniref:Uncharacterized protein n=2 Tax=Magallana gigas TaxID=29159 RepID=A0A8W8J1H0_MAGGI|nr:uncharacterized protein LOC109618444 [Crassostrea gigas]